MKTLILYDSKYGNTKRIAEAIADVFGSKKNAVSVGEFKENMLDGVGLLIVGSPTQAWNATPQLKLILSIIREGNGIKAAAFDTGINSFLSGSAAKKIEKMLSNKKYELTVQGKRFFVLGKEGPLAPGEIESAQKWAEELKKAAGIS